MPTQEQLLKVFEAAKELVGVSVFSPEMLYRGYVKVSKSKFGALSDSVRAAEQPWTVTQTGTGHLVQLRYESVIMVDLPDSHANSAFLARIARLLNEDDTKKP